MREVWPILNRETIMSSCQDERFEEDSGVGSLLIECHEELMNEQ